MSAGGVLGLKTHLEETIVPKKEFVDKSQGEIVIFLIRLKHYRLVAQPEFSRTIYKRGKTLRNFLPSEIYLQDNSLHKKRKEHFVRVGM